MRMWFPWCALCVVVGLALSRSAVAESRDHTGPDEPAASSSTSSPQSGAPVLTRQEALIQGLKQIQIPSEGIRDLVKATEKTANLNPQKFSEIVDKIQGEGNFTKEQGDQLKQLFTTELGEVKNAPVGLEINTAAKRVLEAAETTRVTTPDPNAKALAGEKGAPDGSLAGNASLASALPSVLEGRLSQLESQLGAGKGQPLSKEEVNAKQAALTQELLSRLDRGDRGGGRGSREAGGLLDALRAQLLNDKNGEGKGGGGDLGDLGKALAQNQQHLPPPPPRKNDSKDDKKIEPPPRPERERDRESLGGLAGLLKSQNSGNGNNNKDDKNAKGEEKFELPPSKFKDDPDKKPSTSKNDTSKNPAGEQPEPIDPSELAKNLLKGDLGPKSPLQGIGGGGGGFGGGFGDGGGFGGGGAPMGPNIIGSASAPPGGNFGGDPFSGLGGGEGGGGGASGFSFAKTVAYGGSGGEGGGGGDDEGGGGTVDGGPVYGPDSPRNAASAARGALVLTLTPVEDSTKRSLMDYFGKLKSTLCGENSGDVEVCKKLQGRKYMDALQKRSSVR